MHISADPLGSSGRVEVLCSPFGETRVRETLGPRGHTATRTYPHLPPPTPTYRDLRRLVTLPQNSNENYTGVDPKQEFCKLGDHWGITGNFEGGKAHLATGVGHLSWVTCPGSPVLGSLGDL